MEAFIKRGTTPPLQSEHPSAKEAFFKACKSRETKNLEAYLKSGLVSADELDDDGLRALDHACFLGSEDMAKLLVDYGSCVKSASENGVTALHTSALGGRSNLVHWLAHLGADINATNKDGMTPLHFASDGRAAVVAALLKLGADANRKTNCLGYSALHRAVLGKHLKIAQLLLEHHAEPNIQGVNGDTPLHLACVHGYLEIAELLVKYGASVHKLNKDGKTPRQVAQDERQLRIMAWLDGTTGGKSGSNEIVVAIEDVTGSMPEHLSFNEGDFIEILSKPYEDWWNGRVSHTGRTGLFCILMVDTRPLVLLEGKLTPEMQLQQTDASLKISMELKSIIEETSEELPREEADKFKEFKAAPLLAGKYQALRLVKKLAKQKRRLLSALKNVLSDLDCDLDKYPEFAEDVAGDLIEASIKSHEKQRSGIKQKLHHLQSKGEMDAEKAEELAYTLDEKTQSLSNWNTMMMESKQVRVFCVRFIHKLSEALVGIKAMYSYLQSNSVSSPLWTDPWAQCCTTIVLLKDCVALPGYTLILGHQTDDTIKPKIMQRMEKIVKLVPHVHLVDEVAMGTCIILSHVYFNQITQLTIVGAAMLADGAVMHLLDYLNLDCPENFGTYVTVEALGRAPVFARRSDLTARRLKLQTLPRIKSHKEQWNINGIFRLTGVRTIKGKKFRSPSCRSDLYGYRNGSKAEAYELCMAPVGEEDTIKPKGRKKLHSSMTDTLYRKPSVESPPLAERVEQDNVKSKSGSRNEGEMKRLGRVSLHVEKFLSCSDDK